VTQKKFLTTADITELYGIDDATVRELVDNGDLKALADRGTWKYRRDDIETLIKGGLLQPTKELPTVDDIDFDDSIGFGDDGTQVSEQVDFLELDEEALSDQATIISHGGEPGLDELQLSFNAQPETGPSSSDVQVFDPQSDAGSESDWLATGSSVDVPVADEVGESHSDVAAVDLSAADFAQLDEVAPETSDETASAEDMDFVDVGTADAGETSAISDDALAISDGDSGLTFETQDSGLTLATPGSDAEVESLASSAIDDALGLDGGDSGLTLETGDSGLTLDTGDSGLTLEVVSDSDVTVPKAEATQRMAQQAASLDEEIDFDSGSGDSGGTRRLAVEEQFAEELSFVDDDEQDTNQTAVIMVDDDDATSDYIGTLSGAIDAGQEVEDLEVIDDLDAAVYEEDEEHFDTAHEDDVIEAEDAAFSDEFEGESAAEGDDDSYLTPAAKSFTPREPSWGAPAAMMVIVAGLLVGTNFWLVIEGMMTMWTGAETSGPAASIISTLSGLLG